MEYIVIKYFPNDKGVQVSEKLRKFWDKKVKKLSKKLGLPKSVVTEMYFDCINQNRLQDTTVREITTTPEGAVIVSYSASYAYMKLILKNAYKKALKNFKTQDTEKGDPDPYFENFNIYPED